VARSKKTEPHYQCLALVSHAYCGELGNEDSVLTLLRVLSLRCGDLPALRTLLAEAGKDDKAEIILLTRRCRRLSRTTVLVQFQRCTSLARRAASFCATFYGTSNKLVRDKLSSVSRGHGAQRT
jgi:hypothetical protein